jgi:hypothetical protein
MEIEYDPDELYAYGWTDVPAWLCEFLDTYQDDVECDWFPYNYLSSYLQITFKNKKTYDVWLQEYKDDCEYQIYRKLSRETRVI